MIKYYLNENSITEIEYKPRVKFIVRDIPFDSIKDAVKKMTSTINFFELLADCSDKTKEYLYGCEEFIYLIERWYETDAALTAEGWFNFRLLVFLAETAFKNPVFGLHKVGKSVLENYSRQQLNNSITADVSKCKVYNLTGKVHFDNTDDVYRLEVDFSDCTLKSYKNDELITVLSTI